MIHVCQRSNATGKQTRQKTRQAFGWKMFTYHMFIHCLRWKFSAMITIVLRPMKEHIFEIEIRRVSYVSSRCPAKCSGNAEILCELCDKNEYGGNGDGDNVDTYIELLVANGVMQISHAHKIHVTGIFCIGAICFFPFFYHFILNTPNGPAFCSTQPNVRIQFA